jgi:hypothetical protein
MKLHNQFSWSVKALTVVVLTLMLLGSMATAQADVKIVPINENAYGNTYGEWSARWWQYMLSIPNATSPISDTTGQFCDQAPASPMRQSGPVFFLAGTPGGPALTRNCTVPAGKALFFPIVNALFGAAVGDCEPTASGVPCNLATLRKSSADSMDSVQLTATVDGKAVDDLTQQRVQSPELDITFPGDNVVYTPNVSDGYWVMLPPLRAGTHTVHFKGVITGGVFQGAVIEVTYILTVLGGT